MPAITFEPTDVDAGWNFSLEGEAPRDVFNSGHGLGWAVKVSRDGTVRLATGSKLNELPGRVWFSIGTATPEGREIYQEGTPPKWGVLVHYGADENPNHYPLPEAYTIKIHVSRSTYEALRSLVAARTLPTIHVSVGSESSIDPDVPEPQDAKAIQYGWEPDGSGLEWDNKRFRALEVKWCAFRVDVGLPKSEDDETQPDRSLMPPTRGDLTRNLESVVRRLEQLGRALMLPLWIVVILLAVLVFRR